MILLFTLIFLVNEKLFATCRVDESLIDRAFRNPKDAKTFVIGEIKTERDKIIFSSKKPWDEVTFVVDTAECSGHGKFKDKTKLLFVSSMFKEQLKDKLVDSGMGSFIEFESLSSISQEMKNVKELPKGKLNILWKNCYSDKSCIVVKNQCGGDEVISMIYKNQLEKNLKNSKCELQSRKKKLAKPMCVNYFCE